MDLIDNVQIHPVTDAFIKKTKRTYLWMLIFIPIGVLLASTLLLSSKGSIKNIPLFATIFIGMTLFIEVEILIVSKVLLKKIKANTLTIGTDFLQRKSKKIEEPILFKDIQKLFIKKEANGTIAYINIKAGSRTIRLCGFENLEALSDLLIAEAPHALIKESQYKLDYNHPAIFGLIFFGTLFIFLFFNTQLSIPLNDLVVLGFAIWFIAFKPLSNAQGKRFRLFEIIVGGLIIISLAIEYLSLLLG